ncbi:MAG: anthranilate synthase component I [Planctomycetia bacterium]|nr:MAG: anthranilate synthase component I [Planctomycetia bacterium]
MADARSTARLRSAETAPPLVATLIADDLTPVSAFARLSRGESRAFLFESVVGGERVARYSFLGAAPVRGQSTSGAAIHETTYADGRTRELPGDDPLRAIESALGPLRQPPQAGLPRFLGGAVGYAAYDLVRRYEPLPEPPTDDRGLPDVQFDLYSDMVVFDHAHRTVLLVVGALDAAAPDEALTARIESLAQRLATPVPLAPLRAGKAAAPPWTSNRTRADFEDAVRRAQEYIRAGDAFQVVLSQRLRLETVAQPFDIYRALRHVNPSPFMFYLASPQVTLVGASPEIMCRAEQGVVTSRPLAGTRPRGATDAEDARLRDELLADEKERAEHIMLVDLARNDVGRVCRPGSVRVGPLMTVENYSHVMHISSTVTGELRDGCTAFDALRAALPVGTVSGAPKVRAMQIIDELEPHRRGPYAGAVGYVDFGGNMDTCIALRTLVMRPLPDGRFIADAQAGAGVVADSVPDREYEETLNKAAGLLAAVGLAEDSLRDSG